MPDAPELARVTAVFAAYRDAETWKRQAAVQAHAAGHTYTEIARAAGITRQSAWALVGRGRKAAG